MARRSQLAPGPGQGRVAAAQGHAVVAAMKRVDNPVVGPRQNPHPRVVAWTLALDHHIWSLGGVSDPWPGRGSVDGREGRDWNRLLWLRGHTVGAARFGRWAPGLGPEPTNAAQRHTVSKIEAGGESGGTLWPTTLRLRPQSKNYTLEGVVGKNQLLSVEKHGRVAWGHGGQQ